jgi:hypothetical protein
MGEIVRGAALQHGGRGGSVVYVIGDLHQLRGGNGVKFSVGAASHSVSDAVAGLELGDAFAQLLHLSGGFRSNHRGQRKLVQSTAMVGIDKIDAGVGELDQHFAGAGQGRGEIAELERVDAPGLFDKYSFHSCRNLRRRCTVPAYNNR